MCYITATELKKNLRHYMELSEKEDVFVTKNGKILTVLTSPSKRGMDSFFELSDEISRKIDPNKIIDINKALEEEIKRRCGF